MWCESIWIAPQINYIMVVGTLYRYRYRSFDFLLLELVPFAIAIAIAIQISKMKECSLYFRLTLIMIFTWIYNAKHTFISEQSDYRTKGLVWVSLLLCGHSNYYALWRSPPGCQQSISQTRIDISKILISPF